MDKIPELGEGVESVKNQGRNLLPWLPDPFRCPECGVFCKTSRTWDPQLCEPVDSWKCGECEQHYRRME